MQQHKISEWLNVLPEPYRSQALENFKNIGNPDTCVDRIHKASLGAFHFDASPQKHDYWWDFMEEIKYKEMPKIPLPPQPASVHTWIPVTEISKYAEIGESAEYQNIIGWYGESWEVVNYDNEKGKYCCNELIGVTDDCTHIMIIEPPKNNRK